MPARLALAFALLAPCTVRAQHTHGQGHSPAAHVQHMSVVPKEAGQSAFAAIQEITEILEADPATDWSKVDIEALRRHLVDMDNVTLRAKVAAEPLKQGARFVVTGDGEVTVSIRRMVSAHAATMNGIGGWTMQAEKLPDGAALTVLAAVSAESSKIRALGFIGVMTRGMHHQDHHLMIARGHSAHN